MRIDKTVLLPRTNEIKQFLGEKHSGSLTKNQIHEVAREIGGVRLSLLDVDKAIIRATEYEKATEPRFHHIAEDIIRMGAQWPS